MLKTMLQDTIDPDRMVKQNRILTGEVPLDKLLNLRDMLVGTYGHVKATIEGTEYQGYRKGALRCQLEGHLVVTCQRCLSETPIKVSEDFHLVFVRNSDEEAGLPASVHSWLLSEDTTFSLWSVLEEILVLSIPIVPKHEDVGCQSWENSEAEEDKKASPFGALATLLKK